MVSNEVTFEESPLTNRPGIVVGYRANGKPIYNVAGGSIDVTSDDDSDGDDDSDESGDDDAEEEWAPPTKDEWAKLQADKKKADSEAAARKRFLRDAGFDPKTGRPIEKPTLEVDDDDEVLPKKAVVAQQPETQDDSRGFDREKFEKQFQRQLDREVQKAASGGRKTAYSLISEVPAALEEAGWNGKNLPRMIKLLDLDSVEIDDDGVDYDALSSQVNELKRDFPEFFKRSRMKEAAKEVADAGVAGGGRKQAPASTEELDWKTKMRLQLLNGGSSS
jgi:hypothetical protein